MAISSDVLAVHVDSGQESDTLASQWTIWWRCLRARPGWLGQPGGSQIPYRFVIRPILEYVLDLEKTHPRRQIAVLIPELVERRWYLNLLHNIALLC